MWRVGERKYNVIQCETQREKGMKNYTIYVVLESNLSSIIFFRNHECIIQKRKGIMRSIIFRPHGETTMFYVNGSVIRLGSHLFIVLIHSNFKERIYLLILNRCYQTSWWYKRKKRCWFFVLIKDR